MTTGAGAGEVFVERLTLRPMLACNFRCKYCNEYSPHYAPSQAQPLEEILRDFDRAIELIDRIRILEVSGGEPLMYRPLPQVLRHAAQYSGRFEFFSLVTNGSIRFGDEVLSALRDMGPKVRVILDDYGPKLSKHARANAELLAAKSIRYELRDQYANVHLDGWIDFNDLSQKHDEEAAKRLFAQCACPQKLRWVVTLHNGRLYPCHVLRRCTEIGIVPIDPRECIDVHDKNLTDGEIRANIMGLYGLSVLSACRYCAGHVEGRERIAPAEQLPRSVPT